MRTGSRACFATMCAALLIHCGRPGGYCRYETTQAEVTVDSFGAEAGCTDVHYTWPTDKPSKFPAFDQLRMDRQCLASNNVVVGSTFTVERQDEVSGTCTPSIHKVVDDAVAACVCPN